MEKYRESTRENLLEQKQLSIDNQRDTDILNAVVDNSEVVCSTASIDEAYDTQLKAYTNMLSVLRRRSGDLCGHDWKRRGQLQAGDRRAGMANSPRFK